MAEEEIRRRKTADPEMDAIIVVSQALAPLSRASARRVLKWAEARYVDCDMDGLTVDQMESTNKFMEAVAVTGSRIGLAKPIELVQAMARVAEQLPEVQETVAP